MRILIIDDSEDSGDITEAALFSGGYQDIVRADSGHAAFKLLEIGGRPGGTPPAIDVILLDIMMPEIDGIETCARIRSDARYVDMPIIMVTSLEDMQSLANAFLAGASDYVTKPVNRIELIARVRSALRLKAELDRRLAREHELLEFVSSWGDRHAAGWIDAATGLFVGEGAEAYLTALTERAPSTETAVLALAVDRIDAVRAARGDAVANGMLERVAGAVRNETASIGAVAAAYRNGMIVVVAPESAAADALWLGEKLRGAVARLALRSRDAVAADHVTATVSVATARVGNKADRVNLLTRAITQAQRTAAAGGNRLVVARI